MLFSCLMRFIFEKIQYQDGQLVGADNEVNLFKGVMTFMTNSLKKYIPFVIKAIPEIKIEGKWLSEHLDNCITSLNSVGFNVCAIISDNHSTNILAFKYLFNICRNKRKGENINHPSFYPSTFLQLLSGRKNSILNWVLKLNLFKSTQVFFLFLFRKILDRFFILLHHCFYSYKLR